MTCARAVQYSWLHNFRTVPNTESKTPSDMKFPKNIDKRRHSSANVHSLLISDDKSSVSDILPEDLPSVTS